MRLTRGSLLGVVTGALLFAQHAPAQDSEATTEADASNEATEAEEGSAQGAPNEVEVRPIRRADDTQAPEKPGTVHTIVRGDTLWDLSQSYLGSPWYWP